MPELATTLREQSLAREILATVAQLIDRGGTFRAASVGAVAQALARYRVELATVHPDISSLSPREREVVDGLCAGLRLLDIAKRLHISHHTARNHLKHAFRKMRVTSQIELMAAMRGVRPWAAEQEAANGSGS